MTVKINYKYDSIQVMRGIAALSVIFVHVIMFNNGEFGVDLFFCISGFIMMHVTEKQSKNFLQKRIVRIVPLYWATTLFTSILLLYIPSAFKSVDFSFEYLVKSMLFIPFFIYKNGNIANALSPVGWTLIFEVYFYILFYISTKVNHKHRHLVATAILLSMVLVGLWVDSESVFINFYCRPVILEFALGMFAYKLLKNRVLIEKGAAKKMILAISAVLIWAGLFAEKYIDLFDGVDRFIKYGLPSFVFFIIFFILLENKKIPRAFIILGNISYSLYLAHGFIVQGFSRLIYNIDNLSILGVILTFTVVIPVTICISWVSWFLIEDKFSSWLRKKLINP